MTSLNAHRSVSRSPQASEQPAQTNFSVTLPRSNVNRVEQLRAGLDEVTLAARDRFTSVQSAEAENTFSAVEFLARPTAATSRWPAVFQASKPTALRYAAAFVAGGIRGFSEQFDSNYQALELDGLAAWRRTPSADKDTFFAQNAALAPVRTFLDDLEQGDVDADAKSKALLRPIMAGLVRGETPLTGLKRAADFLSSEGPVTIEARRRRAGASSRARVSTRNLDAYEERAWADYKKPSLIVKLPVNFAALENARAAKEKPSLVVTLPVDFAKYEAVRLLQAVGDAPAPKPSLIVKLRLPRLQEEPASPGPAQTGSPAFAQSAWTAINDGHFTLPPVFFAPPPVLGKRFRHRSDDLDVHSIRHLRAPAYDFNAAHADPDLRLPPLRPQFQAADAPSRAPSPATQASLYENKRLGQLDAVTCTLAAKHFVLAQTEDEASKNNAEAMVVNGVSVEMTWGELRDMARSQAAR